MASNFNTSLSLDITPFLNALKKAASESGIAADKIEASFSGIDPKITIDTAKVGAEGTKAAQTFGAKFKDAIKGGGLGDAFVGGLIGGGVSGIVSSAAGAIVGGLKDAITIGATFEQTLAGVSAVTGITGEGLQDIGVKARDLAKQFGGEASDQLKGFQTTLSRFGADLAQSPEALAKFAENANILAKAGGLAADQGVDALTNAMLQFGVDVTDPNTVISESSRFINVLAASARVGAAEIPQVVDALLVAGGAAKGANVSFEETNAAIQVLAANGKLGAEAGTALRNTFAALTDGGKDQRDALKALGTSYEKIGDILTTQGLGAALNELKVKLGQVANESQRSAITAKLFGKENQNAATVLINNADVIKEWTGEMTGTEDAAKQAAVNMNTFSETVNRLTANVKDLAIPVFNALSKGAAFVIGALKPIFTSIVPALSDAFGKLWSILQPILALVGGAIITTLVGGMTILAETTRIVADVFNDVYDTVLRALEPITSLFSGVGEGVDVMKLFGDLLALVRIGIQALSAVISTIANIVITALISPFEYVVKIFRNVYDAIFPVEKSLGGVAKATEKTGDSTKKTTTFIEDITNAFGAFQDILKAVQVTFTFVIDTLTTAQAALATLNFKKAFEALGGLGEIGGKFDEARANAEKLRTETAKIAAQNDKFAELRRSIDETGRNSANLSEKELKAVKAKLAASVQEALTAEQISAKQNETLLAMIKLIGAKQRMNILNEDDEKKQKTRLQIALAEFKNAENFLKNELKTKNIRIDQELRLGEITEEQAKAKRRAAQAEFEELRKTALLGKLANGQLQTTLDAFGFLQDLALPTVEGIDEGPLNEVRGIFIDIAEAKERLLAGEKIKVLTQSEANQVRSLFGALQSGGLFGPGLAAESARLLREETEFQLKKEKLPEEAFKAFLANAPNGIREGFASSFGVFEDLLGINRLTQQVDAGKAAFEDFAIAGVAMFGELAVASAGSGKAIVGSMLDTLDAMAPIIAAQIFGLYAASPNPVNIFGLGVPGAVAAAAAVAAFKGLIAIARASAGFSEGGYTGNGGVNDIAGVVHGREFVLNANATQKHRALMEHMNRGGDPRSFFVDNNGAKLDRIASLLESIPNERMTRTAAEIQVGFDSYLYERDRKRSQLRRLAF